MDIIFELMSSRVAGDLFALAPAEPDGEVVSDSVGGVLKLQSTARASNAATQAVTGSFGSVPALKPAVAEQLL